MHYTHHKSPLLSNLIITHFAGELKAVYQAFTKEEAELALDKLEDRYGKK